MSNLNLSLTALHTFSVVAKELNFTSASGILHISPSAVSHQMKLLESQLGMSLFHRKSKGVTLTRDAILLAEHINKGFNILEFGIDNARRSSQTERVVLAVIPSLLEHWLIPKLGDFYQRYPHIELQLIAQDQLVDFNREHVDAHLHFGHGQYQGLSCTQLATEWVYPVCAPSYSKRLDGEAHLLSYQGGKEDAPGCIGWTEWFEKQSINSTFQDRLRAFSHVGHILTAAKYGQGFALGWHHIASEMIKQGTLVKLPYKPLSMPFSYFFVMPNQSKQSRGVRYVREWLAQQFTHLN
ncbi:LysR substrate-binding domain-containing protein [Pseudoalteromonas luteoviolacea]|uniref:HTH lysR-type domain-containing protein n=1 Tax=Pseudoalteromonas luteoviolacea S4054 TaxID=1129367 RepID=A0A0F6A6R0_9GAMM|nr:LysR substrate-binding domain-containing protein [Pseudoalteromonas luteoviolacea]AOT10992.1 hypothetical protein S4054249_24450 [Pseudoalteromonas luteoviolacea]AOT15844.1 hypothetical protein S40542_24060 [Pseudoalteromonas luteoviolacea]AOT20813.1 hypothetical protein S4054_24370 [Pseudoalteromonas luteoviolacea]KKE81892.1 hypothetical protein N479_20880 [Pseudoalteromonas luteoviolacea S4054]KZN72223.1 hypothetical protein N481_16175 [Pseudoalteromonas luteoviolacea S4047-1]